MSIPSTKHLSFKEPRPGMLHSLNIVPDTCVCPLNSTLTYSFSGAIAILSSCVCTHEG